MIFVLLLQPILNRIVRHDSPATNILVTSFDFHSNASSWFAWNRSNKSQVLWNILVCLYDLTLQKCDLHHILKREFCDVFHEYVPSERYGSNSHMLDVNSQISDVKHFEWIQRERGVFRHLCAKPEMEERKKFKRTICVCHTHIVCHKPIAMDLIIGLW